MYIYVYILEYFLSLELFRQRVLRNETAQTCRRHEVGRTCGACCGPSCVLVIVRPARRARAAVGPRVPGVACTVCAGVACCIFVHTDAYAQVHTGRHARVRKSLFLCTKVYVYVYVDACVYMYVHVSICIYVCTYMLRPTKPPIPSSRCKYFVVLRPV